MVYRGISSATYKRIIVRSTKLLRLNWCNVQSMFTRGLPLSFNWNCLATWFTYLYTTSTVRFGPMKQSAKGLLAMLCFTHSWVKSPPLNWHLHHDSFENNIGIKHDITNYSNESFQSSSKEEISFKYEICIFWEISQKWSGLFDRYRHPLVKLFYDMQCHADLVYIRRPCVNYMLCMFLEAQT